MITFFAILQIIIIVFLTILILLQNDSEDAMSSFSNNSMYKMSAANKSLKHNPIVKVTYILVFAFICNSIGLTYLYSHYGNKKEKDAVNIIAESFKDTIIKKDPGKIDNFKEMAINNKK